MAHKMTAINGTTIFDGWTTNVSFIPLNDTQDTPIIRLTGKNGCPEAGKRDDMWIETETRKHTEIIETCKQAARKIYGIEIDNIRINSSLQYHWHKEYQKNN